MLGTVPEENGKGVYLTPAGRVASMSSFLVSEKPPGKSSPSRSDYKQEGLGQYELGDCLLGPTDVAILLQAGLTSVMKGSSVVQLNQRMLLDLVASQPKSFAVAVLAEIGTPGGQGSPRQLTSGKKTFPCLANQHNALSGASNPCTCSHSAHGIT
jgi:hypothetical protein